MMGIILAFISGFLVEGICTLWVSAVAKKQAAKAGLLSCFWAAALLVGLEQALPGGVSALSWVLGYGLGSYIAVKIDNRRVV